MWSNWCEFVKLLNMLIGCDQHDIMTGVGLEALQLYNDAIAKELSVETLDAAIVSVFR